MNEYENENENERYKEIKREDERMIERGGERERQTDTERCYASHNISLSLLSFPLPASQLLLS